MRNKELPPECYPATVRIPGSFLIRDDRDLIEIVGRMCGDDVRDVLRERLEDCPIPAGRAKLKELVDQIASAVHSIECELTDIENAVEEINV